MPLPSIRVRYENQKGQVYEEIPLYPPPRMSIISQETIQKILDETDIVELIQGYFPLKRAGVNYLALCPFHNEKSPSFNVNPQRQTFHCFGCGEGGDAIKFIESNIKS